MQISKINPDERPKYRVLAVAGFFGPDDNLYEEGAEIYFDGEPAEEMEPLNEAARLRYIEMIERLEDMAKKTAEKLGKPYTGRPRNLDGALAIATEVERMNMSVMGNRNKDGSIIAPAKEETADTGLRKRGRPRKVETLASVANG